MKNVAEAAAVSIQTVSAVINNKPGITQATSDRVLEAIQKLGYRPFSIARSLRTRQTDTIALFVSDIAAPPLAAMASAIENEAYTRGYSLVVYNTHNVLKRESDYMLKVIDRWVDGVIIIAIDEHETSLKAFMEAQIPVVAVDRVPENSEMCSVSLNNYRVGQLAAEHLLGLGHTTLGAISGPLHLTIGHDRKKGFIDECLRSGATVIPGEFAGDWHTRSGYNAMRQMLTQAPWPTAIFASSDLMAIGAISAINEAGLRVPDDISIVGVDNIEQAEFTVPPLTTILQPLDRIGQQGVRLLLDLVDGREIENRNIIIEPTILVRSSTSVPHK
ncbi:MAG: LacI family DNA-binding transcriptional regulator [Anaerolineae bacterium]